MIEPQEGVNGVCLRGKRGVCVIFFTNFPNNEVGLCKDFATFSRVRDVWEKV
jgi:hypothetical protein